MMESGLLGINPSFGPFIDIWRFHLSAKTDIIQQLFTIDSEMILNLSVIKLPDTAWSLKFLKRYIFQDGNETKVKDVCSKPKRNQISPQSCNSRVYLKAKVRWIIILRFKIMFIILSVT